MVVAKDCGGEEEMGSYCLMGMDSQLGKMKRFWRRITVMVIQ